MLKVKEIKEPTGATHPPPVSEILPTHEFSLLLVAPRGQGKTTLLLNMLSDFYKGYFHTVKVFSPTMDGDAKWETVKKMKGLLAENKNLKDLENAPAKGPSNADESEDDGEEEESVVEGTHAYNYATAWNQLFATSQRLPKQVIGSTVPPEQKLVGHGRTLPGGKSKNKKFDGKIPSKDFHTEYDEDTLSQVMEDSLAQIVKFKKIGKSKHSADRQLIIFDDLVGSSLFSAKRVNPFRRLNTTLRHYSTSIIMVTQGYREVPKTARINASCVILFEIANQSELEVIYEENSCGLTKDEWFKIFRYCTSAPFNFMFINYKREKENRIMRNFDEQIPINPKAKDKREAMQKKDRLDEGVDLEPEILTGPK